MPIEFHCPDCRQMLRVPDSAAGKQAKCPQCGTLAGIPHDAGAGAPPSSSTTSPPPAPTGPGGAGPGGAGPSASSGPSLEKPGDDIFGDLGQMGASLGELPAGQTNSTQPSPFGESPAASTGDNYQNPYAASTVADGPSYAPVGGSGPIVNVQVDPADVMRHGFDCWKRDVGTLTAAAFVLWLLGQIFGFVTGFTLASFLGVGNSTQIVAQLIMLPVQSYLTMGLLSMAMASGRGERIELGMMFYRGPNTGGKLLRITIFSLILFGSIFLLFVPFVILMLLFWPFTFVVIDKDAAFGDAFSMAREVSRNNVGGIFLIFIVSVLVVIVGLLALCFGVFFAQALITLYFATAYLMMGGQIKTAPSYR